MVMEKKHSPLDSQKVLSKNILSSYSVLQPQKIKEIHLLLSQQIKIVKKEYILQSSYMIRFTFS